MIIPIGHETSTVRRLPWVTFIIMAGCLAAHIMISGTISRQAKELGNTAQEIFQYYMQHTYLELDPEIKKLFFPGGLPESMAELYGYMRKEPDRYTLEEEQAELDRLTEKFMLVYQTIPYRKYGFIPAERTTLGIITYMFIHAGWLHLLGNLFFLYLSGPFIEDVWGRSLYAVFFLLMGVVSALMFATHYPNSTMPLVGASGAISGVMGAFLVRYFKTKIKFFYLFFPFARGTFKAPAWLMLPLWLFLELVNAKLMDAINPGGGSGVAHWAHIWGFIFGFFFAIGMNYFQIEEKYIHKKIESKISLVEPAFQAYEDAMEVREMGKNKEAFAMLLAGVQKYPDHPELVDGLWTIGIEMGREIEASTYLIKAIESLLEKNNFETALRYYRELKKKVPQASLSSYFKIKLMEFLQKEGEIGEATGLAKEVLSEIDSKSPPGIIIKFALAVKNLDGSIEKDAVELALGHPDIPEEQKNDLRTRVDRFKIKPTTQAAADDDRFKLTSMPQEHTDIHLTLASQPDAQKQKNLKVIHGIPLYIRKGKIGLKIKNIGNRHYELKKILAISGARIFSGSETPFCVIDMFIDDPRSDNLTLRTIRLKSSTFDPKQFMPHLSDKLEALEAFISTILRLSGAQPYPDSNSLVMKYVREFPSIKDYEQSL
jgi:membrane associated rhomboid family serine protease